GFRSRSGNAWLAVAGYRAVPGRHVDCQWQQPGVFPGVDLGVLVAAAWGGVTGAGDDLSETVASSTIAGAAGLVHSGLHDIAGVCPAGVAGRQPAPGADLGLWPGCALAGGVRDVGWLRILLVVPAPLHPAKRQRRVVSDAAGDDVLGVSAIW